MDTMTNIVNIGSGMQLTKDQALWVIQSIQSGKTLQSCFKELRCEPYEFFDVVWGTAELSLMYDRAQKARAEFWVEEIVDIADTEQDSSKARNRIDARRWYATKMQPNKYGERIDVNVNQVVSITDALADAKKRLLPNDASQHIIEGELVDTKQVSDQRTTDTQSVETLEIKSLSDILE